MGVEKIKNIIGLSLVSLSAIVPFNLYDPHLRFFGSAPEYF